MQWIQLERKYYPAATDCNFTIYSNAGYSSGGAGGSNQNTAPRVTPHLRTINPVNKKHRKDILGNSEMTCFASEMICFASEINLPLNLPLLP